MNNLIFSKVTSKVQIKEIEQLAKITWNDHYVSLIGQQQVDYMLSTFQSEASIEKQIVGEKYVYYLISYLEKNIGYFAIQQRADLLFLSKFYILKTFQGKGLGKSTMGFIKQQAKDFKCNRIGLQVNKENEYTIEFYQKSGFNIIEPILIDIGNGYVMDDYWMIAEI
jgi:diamine N-acetyltransferase